MMKRLFYIGCLILIALFCVNALAEEIPPCVDNAVSLSDGVYTPDGFQFEGGSGRVIISCDSITVQDGKSYALIRFSSSRYAYVKASGAQFDPTGEGEGSAFLIPIRLNAPNVLIGMTTAMSAPHEVRYTIHVDLTEAKTEQTGLAGLNYLESMPLDYAEGFSVDFYEGGYALIDIEQGDRYLVIPEDGEVPTGLDASVICLRQPIENIYIAGTASMALFNAMDALDCVRMSSQQADSWSIENAAAAMERGDILYGGKYSEPDYEMLIRENCGLAIENTMIFHTPKVKEMIELLGIPVLLDRSSYEPNPLGRTEWIKLYGVLVGKTEAATAFFNQQKAYLKTLGDFPNTEKRVAFFYVAPDGSVVVRSSTDIIARQIELAGGRYLYDDLIDSESARTNVTLTMERFYADAMNADILIYNSAREKPLTALSELVSLNPLFKDFKAVREGNVWCCGNAMYQATDRIGTQINDLHIILTESDEDPVFLKRLE